MENKHSSFKVVHLVASFLIGVVLTGLVLTFTGSTGTGFIGREGKGVCTVDNCDLNHKLDQLLDIFAPYSGVIRSMTPYTSQFTKFTPKFKEYTPDIDTPGLKPLNP